MTSFRCVAAVRRLCDVKKAGHAGTLDPEAEGVLPICIGKAVKCSEYFLRMPKTYRAEVTFGYCTDTMDRWGQETGRREELLSAVNEAAVRDALPGFMGEIVQKTPIYSAVKKDGVPLYKLARKGVETETPLRSVRIYGITLESFSPGGAGELPKAVLSVTCSRGTYIRALCDALGRELGCYAVMSALTRVSYGKMQLADAVTLSELAAAAEEGRTESLVLPLSFVLGELPSVRLQAWEVKRYQEGKTVTVAPRRLVCGEESAAEPGAEVCLYAGDRIFAVALLAEAEAETPGAENGALRLLPNKFFGTE